MSGRWAVTKTITIRYARPDPAAKKQVLDELCATTVWRRGHIRKARRGRNCTGHVKDGGGLVPVYGPVLPAAAAVGVPPNVTLMVPGG